MKNKYFGTKWVLAVSVAAAVTTFLVVGCQSSTPPSNLSLSEADAQKIQDDRLQTTNQTHQIVMNIRDALSPVEGVLKDLSNIDTNVAAKIGGKSLDNLHLSDAFQLIDQMLENSNQSGLVNTSANGGWTMTSNLTSNGSNGSVIIDACDSVQVELSGKRDGDREDMALHLVECGSSEKILLADIHVNKDAITAALHLENLKALSISTSTSVAACSLQATMVNNQLVSKVDCNPIEIQMGSGHVEISPLSVNLDAVGLSAKVGVHGFDGNGKSVLALSYPKSESSDADVSGSSSQN